MQGHEDEGEDGDEDIGGIGAADGGEGVCHTGERDKLG